MECITKLEGDEKFVAMTQFADQVIICSDKSVYELKDNALKPIELKYSESPAVSEIEKLTSENKYLKKEIELMSDEAGNE